jgi:hypothetical protein
VNRHPVALLGNLAVMEGYPPTAAIAEELMDRTGLPRTAFRQWLEHAELDLQHRDDLYAMLDALPLTPEHEALLGVSALHTVRLLGLAFREVLEPPVDAGAVPMAAA